jgi:hypothetical protein
MKKSFPSLRKNGTKVALADLLAQIPDNNLVWSILEFNGSGTAPAGLTMTEFQTLARATDRGHRLSWPALNEFAASLSDVTDCRIVGALKWKNISATKLDAGAVVGIEVILEAIDSTEWSVWAHHEELLDDLISVAAA